MTELDPSQREGRVLVLAPTGRDGSLAVDILRRADIPAEACQNIHELSSGVGEGAGALIVAQEALLISRDGLFGQLARQPAWSDLPVVLLTTGNEDVLMSQQIQELFGPSNVTLLERPFRTATLVSVVRGALRSRQRQYQVRDLLTQRDRLLESERAARHEAEVANRMKDEFLAGLSHELRTPLNAILGWCQLLKMGGQSSDETAEALDVIERNSHLQAQLIEDLLDVSRIISGKLRLDMQQVNLPEVIGAALSSVMPSADAKGIRVHPAIDSLAPPVAGDPARLQQIVWNLLTNAIKFTPAGGRVRVGLDRLNSHVQISVADSGAGIAPEFLPFVFDRFRQADASTTRRHGGLGLGLSIVRQLVELHGGAARATSAGVGQGATFYVELPVAADWVSQSSSQTSEQRSAPQPAAASVNSAILKGLRVLVVDDDADARNLLERVLLDTGATVATARSADDALGRLAEFAPDMLISDIGMPERDGYDLIRELRSSGKDAKQLPAVALTAFARSQDRQRALMAGFQMHIAKPVNASELTAAVASLAGRTGR
jgi:signal transduction histidine kinase/ActR/RegA family two-component response regulator